MTKASFVYLSIFTICNVLITFYLQSAVNIYKLRGTLPTWVIRTRKFLDHLDQQQDENKSEQFNKEPPSNFNVFGQEFLNTNEPATMPFLQIKPFESKGQLYDVRDDFEYKMSKKITIDLKEKYSEDIDEDVIEVMNKSRERGTGLFNDIEQTEEALFDDHEDDFRDASNETLDNIDTYQTDPKNIRIKNLFNEYEKKFN